MNICASTVDESVDESVDEPVDEPVDESVDETLRFFTYWASWTLTEH